MGDSGAPCTFSRLAPGRVKVIMGAAVLKPQGLVPEGNEMITTLSRMYTDAIGEWASIFFLIGDVPDRCPSPKSAAKSGAVEKGEQVALDREAGFVDLPKQDSRAPTGPGYP